MRASKKTADFFHRLSPAKNHSVDAPTPKRQLNESYRIMFSQIKPGQAPALLDIDAEVIPQQPVIAIPEAKSENVLTSIMNRFRNHF